MAKTVRDFVKNSLNSYYKNFQVKMGANADPSIDNVHNAIRIANDGSIYIHDAGGFDGYNDNVQNASTLQELLKRDSGGGGTPGELIAGNALNIETNKIIQIGYIQRNDSARLSDMTDITRFHAIDDSDLTKNVYLYKISPEEKDIPEITKTIHIDHLRGVDLYADEQGTVQLGKIIDAANGDGKVIVFSLQNPASNIPSKNDNPAFIKCYYKKYNLADDKKVIYVTSHLYNASLNGCTFGSDNFVYAQDGFAQGNHNTINESGIGSHVEGYNNSANGLYSHAEGEQTIIEQGSYCSHTEGYQTKASSDYAHAEGELTHAAGVTSHAEGRSTNSNGKSSHAEGFHTTTTSKGDYAHAEGYCTEASGNYSHAEGCSTVVKGNGSHAEGYLTEASGEYAHAEGYNTEASGEYSHAEGVSRNTPQYWTSQTVNVRQTTYKEVSIVGHYEYFFACNFNLGNDRRMFLKTDNFMTLIHKNDYVYKTQSDYVSGGIYFNTSKNLPLYNNNENNSPTTPFVLYTADNKYAIMPKAIGNGSHTEGAYTEASGEYSHSEGGWTEASGYYSHAEGEGCAASGNGAHAEGYYTEASGEYSHAEGIHNVAIGASAHVSGCYSNAYGNNSHAMGEGLVAYEGQVVIGRWNIKDTSRKYAFIIGNGTDDIARSNAFAVTWAGEIKTSDF